MARPKMLINDEIVARARAQLDVLSENRFRIRLQAIIACKKQPMCAVASEVGITPVTLRRWVRLFGKKGLKGLQDKPKCHRRAKLTWEQEEEVQCWIVQQRDCRSNPRRWTLKRLSAEIQREYGVSLGVTSLWRWLRIWKIHIGPSPGLERD